MPTVHVSEKWTVERLLLAVKQLSPMELSEFTRKLAEWQELSGGSDEMEAALLQASLARLPASLEQRLKRLCQKSERGTLTKKELDEYRALAQRAEQISVQRVEALAELVRFRGKPVLNVQEEIRWEGRTDGS